MSRAKLVEAAGDAIRQGSKSFHMASRLFDRKIRQRAWLRIEYQHLRRLFLLGFTPAHATRETAVEGPVRRA